MREPVYTPDQEAERRRNLHRIMCEGKEPFESRSVAESVARRRSGNGKPNQAYKCHGCGKYHLGRSY